MNSHAERRIPMSGKQETGTSVLVVYYSRGGNTRRVAEDLAVLLGADIECLVDKTNRSGISGFMGAGRDAMRKHLTDIEPTINDPSNYDLVILGTPLWGFGSMTPAIRTYLTQNKGRISRHALFCTRWFKNPTKMFASFEALTGSKPVATLGFTTKELGDSDFSGYDSKVRMFVGQVTGK